MNEFIVSSVEIGLINAIVSAAEFAAATAFFEKRAPGFSRLS